MLRQEGSVPHKVRRDEVAGTVGSHTYGEFVFTGAIQQLGEATVAMTTLVRSPNLRMKTS